MKPALVILLLLPFAGCLDAGDPNEAEPWDAAPDNANPATGNAHPYVEAQGCSDVTMTTVVERSIIEDRLPAPLTPRGSNPLLFVSLVSAVCESVAIGAQQFARDVTFGMVYASVGNDGTDFYIFEAWTDWDGLRGLWKAQGLEARNATMTSTTDPVLTVNIEGDGVQYTLWETSQSAQDNGPLTSQFVFLAGERAQYAFRQELNEEDNPAILGSFAFLPEDGFLADVAGPASVAVSENQHSSQRFIWIENPLHADSG